MERKWKQSKRIVYGDSKPKYIDKWAISSYKILIMCIYLLKEVIKIINLNAWAEPGEEFKVITDFTIPGIEPNRYYCSNFGRIYDSQFHVFRITGKYNDYNYFHYKGKNYPVHRIVKSLF